MNSSLIQLLVLAGIVVFLVLRLRSVLGTREGFEKPPVPMGQAPQQPERQFEVIEGGPSTVESGMLMTPLDHAGVKEVYSDFNRLEIDRMTVTSANGTFIDDDWIVKVVK